MVESHPYLMAIDGGGTSCRFALQTPTGRQDVKLGSANVFTNRERAVQTLLDGMMKILLRAGLQPSMLPDIPVYAGLAGVTDQDTAHQVAARLPARIIEIEDDRRSAVVGALEDRNGCLIGIGTGSFLARQASGAIQFAGGYGPIVGDEASGNWLGLGLLRRALLVLDGAMPASPLVTACLERFENDAARVVAFSGTARPADFAKFAPEVIEAARNGDSVGQELMQTGAQYIETGLRALGYEDGEPVCAVGGVAAHYADYLPPSMALTEPLGTALDGALELARRLAERSNRGVA
ncbi:MAG: BadF/BadG/BcrA/BcrD ATPase family protein [Ruegeria sp.]|uniref:BadF/BadG/BcrA/BcrD ATPase family protein n=1 Tax=Ruegeria sp. TaxID=1879320 RepID=UPI00349E9E06